MTKPLDRSHSGDSKSERPNQVGTSGDVARAIQDSFQPLARAIQDSHARSGPLDLGGGNNLYGHPLLGFGDHHHAPHASAHSSAHSTDRPVHSSDHSGRNGHNSVGHSRETNDGFAMQDMKEAEESLGGGNVRQTRSSIENALKELGACPDSRGGRSGHGGQGNKDFAAQDIKEAEEALGSGNRRQAISSLQNALRELSRGGCGGEGGDSHGGCPPPEQPPCHPPEHPPCNPPEHPPSNPPEQPPSNPPEQPPSNPPEQPPSNPPEQPPEQPPFNRASTNSQWQPES